MPSQLLRETAPSPSRVVWADSTDFGSGGHGLTRTHQLDLTSLAAGAYRQSAVADLGANPAPAYYVKAAFEWITTAPTAGGIVTVSFGFGVNNAAVNFPGNLSLSDAAYNGYGAAAADADEAIGQLADDFPMEVTNDIDIQIADLGIVVPLGRYVAGVVHNDSDQQLNGTDAQEMFVMLEPIVVETQ